MPRQRKPAALKLMQGTDQPCRRREEVAFPLVTEAEPPDWLINAFAINEWHDRVEQLTTTGVLTTADLTSLVIYCNLVARAKMKFDAGSAPTSAEVNQLRMMAGEFGLSPTTRSKPLKAAGEGPKNPFKKHGRGA